MQGSELELGGSRLASLYTLAVEFRYCFKAVLIAR